MAKKFFSIETYSDMTGEITGIITCVQLENEGVQTFDEIQDFVIGLANRRHCKGSIRNEHGMKVLDFNWSRCCEENICFCWEDGDRLDAFIAAHPNVESSKEAA